jgi:hypothetical protein
LTWPSHGDRSICASTLSSKLPGTRTPSRGAEQAQVALDKPGQIEIVEIIHQHGLQVGAEHGFHRQFPTCFNLQAFGQARRSARC